MKIVISGYGKMGKEIQKLALSKNHQISAIVDSKDDWTQLAKKIKAADVVIDFSQPDMVIGNIEYCFRNNLPIVVGTTGWDDRKDEFIDRSTKENQSLFVASNFSIGVNILFNINKQLAAIMNSFPEYKATMEEIHHIHKKDQPSGTAISLANQITSNIDRYADWTINNPERNSQIPITAKRINEVPGTHIITYQSDIDEIEIKHTAKNRIGFAYGALLAAEWLVGKTGYYEMNDLLRL